MTGLSDYGFDPRYYAMPTMFQSPLNTTRTPPREQTPFQVQGGGRASGGAGNTGLGGFGNGPQPASDAANLGSLLQMAQLYQMFGGGKKKGGGMTGGGKGGMPFGATDLGGAMPWLTGGGDMAAQAAYANPAAFDWASLAGWF